MDIDSEIRKLPKVDLLLGAAACAPLVERFGREPVLRSIREELDALRDAIRGGASCPSPDEVLTRAGQRLERASLPSLRRVINATGVIIHTNLGRAPLAEDAARAMAEAAAGYVSLEYDLAVGERGSRSVHAQKLLRELSGAEDAVVVNNNAAAVMLALAALARDREVIISRGQLVEIGGGFRVPDILRQGGAHLVEVGTTNRTYLEDYEGAITERTAMLLVVHRSNFQITGFIHDPTLEELADLARRKGLLLVDDLGSGTLLETTSYGLRAEPTVQSRVRAGADLVCFSGDKLLGGPQAGYLVGKKAVVDLLRKHPLMRALRVDKATYAGIEATLRHYLKGDASSAIPVWRSIAMTLPELEARAQSWLKALDLPAEKARVLDTESAIGGGSLPGLTLPTRALALTAGDADGMATALRAGSPPVVARIEEGALLFDPRTVLPDEDEALVSALKRMTML